MHKKLAEMKSAGADGGSGGNLVAIHKDFDHLDRAQRNLQQKFERLSFQMNQKFDVIMDVLAHGVAERTALEEEILTQANLPYQRRLSYFPTEKKELAKLIVSDWQHQITRISEEGVREEEEDSDEEPRNCSLTGQP